MRARASFIVMVLVAAACGTQEPLATPEPGTAPAPTTTTVPLATAPTVEPGLPAAPWSVPPLPAEAAPSVLGDEWQAAANRGFCAALYPADANDLAADAVVRAADFGEEAWAIAWDRPAGPGRDDTGAYCEDCGRGAFGVAGTTALSPGDAVDGWSGRLEWSDGSSAGYGLEGAAEDGAPHLAFLSVEGQGCSYNVWSFLGEGHLLRVIDELRFVEGMLAAVIQDDPGAAQALGPAPWLRGPVNQAAVPQPLLDEWTEEVFGKATCPLLAPVALGDTATGATARRAENYGEMLAAWDLPDGPGRYGSGEYCADCGRGAIGVGTIGRDVDTPAGFERFAVTHTWDDGSELRIINEGIEYFNLPPERAGFTDPQTGAAAIAPYNGYLLIPGLGCGYRLWSFLGSEHVVQLAQAMRPVIGFGEQVFTSGVCPDGESLRGDFDGDGVEERFVVAPPLAGDPVVLMCHAGAAVPVQISIGGMGEILSLADVDRDGDVEILAGGTTITAGFYEVFTEGEGGFPERVSVGPAGETLTFIDGADGGVGYRWGCRDDGTVVQVEGTLRAGKLQWTRTAYRIEGLAATIVGTGSGSTAVASSDLVDAIFENAVTQLVGDPRCGG